MTKQIIPAVLAVLVVLGGMAYHWRITGTGRGSEELQRFTAAVAKVPAEFGNWTSEDTPLDEDEFARTNCTAYVSRIYRNSETGAEVSVYLVSGTARHITIHTPDWCYQGAGFKMEEEPASYVIELPDSQATAELATARFTKSDINGPQSLRIFWSYAYDGTWQGPTMAKWHYAGKPALYKVYFIAGASPTGDVADNSPSVALAKEFLPILNGVLFQGSGQTPAPPAMAASGQAPAVAAR